MQYRIQREENGEMQDEGVSQVTLKVLVSSVKNSPEFSFPVYALLDDHGKLWNVSSELMCRDTKHRARTEQRHNKYLWTVNSLW